MALEIKKTLNDSSGGTVASGTYIDFSVSFPAGEKKIIYGIFAYKSKLDFDSKKSSYVPLEINNFSPIYEIQSGDFLDSLFVNTQLKLILELMPGIGSGNVIIV